MLQWWKNIFSSPEPEPESKPEPIYVFDVTVYRGPDRKPLEILDCKKIDSTRGPLQIKGINHALTIFHEWEYLTTSEWRPYVP